MDSFMLDKKTACSFIGIICLVCVFRQLRLAMVD